MSTSPNLQLPYLDANQNQKTVTHNAALRMLDALVNLHVASTVLQAPPAAPNDGQCWIVASGGTGAWLGRDLNVAAWQDGAWTFYPPNLGFVAYVDAQQAALMWNGSAWVPLLGGITQLALTALGLGTPADPANPLSAKLNAALFAAVPTTATPAGTGDLRLKLSKQAAGNAASILFQDAYSGRAEIGLVGDDNFHFKVSPDGSTFADAMVVAAAGGAVSFLLTPSHPSPAAGDSSTASATTAWVTGKGYVTSAGAAAAAPVQSVAGRSGAVILGVTDVAGAAPLASPALTGTPTAPNAAPGTNSAQVATTSFVAASFVTYAYASATYAPLANAALTGTPTAPTQPAKDNSTRLATTAYADRGDAAAVARTQVSDAAYAVLPTDRTVAMTALTAARVLTLPAASAYPQGATLTVVDESGACSASATITRRARRIGHDQRRRQRRHRVALWLSRACRATGPTSGPSSTRPSRPRRWRPSRRARRDRRSSSAFWNSSSPCRARRPPRRCRSPTGRSSSRSRLAPSRRSPALHPMAWVWRATPRSSAVGSGPRRARPTWA